MKKEIVTKTVLNRMRKTYSEEVHLPCENLTRVLGCWLLNPVMQYEKKNESSVLVSGTYDVNMWVACENNTITRCIIESHAYEMLTPFLVDDEDVIGECTPIVKWLLKPVCVNARCEDTTAVLQVDQEFHLEWIGETKLRVALAEDELDQIIDEAVDTHYLLK